MQAYKRDKILYIMGIDWEWIYQRPQIFEQHLESIYDVMVVFPRSIMKILYKKRINYPLYYKILWTLPFQEKNKFIGWIANCFHKIIFRNINQYKAIFIGYPLYNRYIPLNYNGKIIYDCMDNYEALYPDKKRIERIMYQEKLLLKRCDCLLVTGEKLKHKIDNLLQENKAILVRNGTKCDKVIDVKTIERKEKYKIGYFGTIAEWFDYSLLLKSLEYNTNIQYNLIGPVVFQCEEINDRMIFEGIVKHEMLLQFVEEYDCMIMPFIVNDVVEWVDPVKLYEYIAFGKCIISAYYKEIERFEEFVYFYNNEREYMDLLRELIKEGFPPKYTKEKQKRFLKENSWEARFSKLDKILVELLEDPIV